MFFALEQEKLKSHVINFSFINSRIKNLVVLDYEYLFGFVSYWNGFILFINRFTGSLVKVNPENLNGNVLFKNSWNTFLNISLIKN